jgi:hypothetical protein
MERSTVGLAPTRMVIRVPTTLRHTTGVSSSYPPVQKKIGRSGFSLTHSLFLSG